MNPAPPACDAGALPDELAAQGRRGDAAAAVPAGTAGLPVVLTLLTSQSAITFPPKGGDPQGRRDSNSRQAVLEAAVLPLNYVPIEMETAPRGFPWGGCLRMPSVALPGSRPDAQGSLKLRGRVHVPVSLFGRPECHRSMVGRSPQANKRFLREHQQVKPTCPGPYSAAAD